MHCITVLLQEGEIRPVFLIFRNSRKENRPLGSGWGNPHTPHPINKSITRDLLLLSLILFIFSHWLWWVPPQLCVLMQSNRWYLSSTPSSTLLTTDPSSPSMTQSSSPTLQEHRLRECYITLIKHWASGYWSSLLISPQVILGVTNPFFAKALEHWPHIIRLADITNSSEEAYASSSSAGGGRSRSPGDGSDTKPGIHTRYKPFLNRDKNFARIISTNKVRNTTCTCTYTCNCMYMYSVWGVRKWNGKIMSFCNNEKLCIH